MDLLFSLALFPRVVVDHALVMFTQAGWSPLPVNFCLVAARLYLFILNFITLGAQFPYRYLLVGTQLTHPLEHMMCEPHRIVLDKCTMTQHSSLVIWTE